MSECDTVSISYDQVLVSQWFSGWNILWISNDIYELILDMVNEKFLSNSVPLLCGRYSSICGEVEIPGCVWPRVLYVTS